VLDCSVVFAWYFVDESDAYADAVALSLTKRSAVVPSLWALEVANTLVIGERRKRSTQAQADAFTSRLASLPILIDEETAQHAWSSTMALARSHLLSCYDAAYLELSIRRRLPLATLDERLKKVATTVGLSIYQPV
jgi:predicted nucleic acid-binding protein